VPTFNPAQPCWTLDGRRADIFAVSELPLEFPISAFVKGADGKRHPVVYSRSGKSRRSPHPLDLTNTPPR